MVRVSSRVDNVTAMQEGSHTSQPLMSKVTLDPRVGTGFTGPTAVTANVLASEVGSVGHRGTPPYGETALAVSW